MKIIIGCEESGKVRDAFIRRGHKAVSCDLLPSRSNFGPHHQGDIQSFVLSNSWDMGIFFPPCTRLSNSGVRWLYENAGHKPLRLDHRMYLEMVQACNFFNFLLGIGIPKMCQENPLHHSHARKLIREYDQIIHPHQFGHLEQKTTCLWVTNLPPLVETNNVYEEMMKLPYGQRAKIHHAAPGPNRARERSETYQGIADAMAEQWG